MTPRDLIAFTRLAWHHDKGGLAAVLLAGVALWVWGVLTPSTGSFQS